MSLTIDELGASAKLEIVSIVVELIISLDVIWIEDDN